MGYDLKLTEKSLILKVSKDFFSSFDTTDDTSNIDFMVADKSSKSKNKEYYFWAEAKRGNEKDIYASIVQLILTIGKAEMKQRTLLPPHYFGAFDADKIAFLPNYKIASVFTQNDFNWNVTPSDHETKEFKQIYEIAKDILEKESLIFYFDKNKAQLKEFIKNNFVCGNTNIRKIQITKNNFKNVYYDWLETVKPTISVNWEIEKPEILDTDFYIADLLSRNNNTEEIRENIRILLKGDYYKVKVKREREKDLFSEFHFTDGQKAHIQFWNNYERPPKEEVQDYIIYRRYELVPQDIRERKGAYFTPRIWVEKAQEYLALALGEDYQDEYYFWDCAAGSGNLLVGLNYKYKIFASTLDKSDVDGTIDRIREGKCDLLENHVFQFDFLNDDFSKLPKKLRDIIKNEPQKLIIFINPPYGEAGNQKQIAGTGKNKNGVALCNKTYEKYKDIVGNASKEIFSQFFIRIYKEIPNCILASFSKLKYINATNFKKFRETFKAKFLKGFICFSETFDNVKGKFPIGFLIWDTKIKEKIENIMVDIFNEDKTQGASHRDAHSVGCKAEAKASLLLGKKNFYSNENVKSINQWIRKTNNKLNKENKILLGHFTSNANDFQHQNSVFIESVEKQRPKSGGLHIYFSEKNLIEICISFSVRHSIETTWINTSDQFLYPVPQAGSSHDKWEKNLEFQSNCLAFTLFHGQNRISAEEGINHWIPFSEAEVGAKDSFESRFMKDFIDGKIKPKETKEPNNNGQLPIVSSHGNEHARGYNPLLLEAKSFIPTKPIKFSKEAKDIFEAGRELWKYYHKHDLININASYYDIRKFFQGVDSKSGRMNNKSIDETYNKLIGNLRERMKILAKKIEPKIYEFGFLKK